MIVVVSNYARLGNQLWTYSNILAYALENRVNVVNASFSQYERYFQRQLPNEPHNEKIYVFANYTFLGLVYKMNLKLKYFPFLNLPEGDSFSLEDSDDFFYLVKNRSYVFLSGYYYVAPLCLEKQINNIRNYFSPCVSWSYAIGDVIRKAREQCDVLIGIHMRQGDYRLFCGGIMFYSTSEYIELMTALQGLFDSKRVGFILCSDEEQNEAAFKGFRIFMGSGHILEDLYLLAACDYILGPNSSFSQWASFYGGVPLHIVDWKCVEKYGTSRIWGDKIIKNPSMADFSIFSPSEFSRFSQRALALDDFKI